MTFKRPSFLVLSPFTMLLTIWIISLLLVNITGEFALIDDCESLKSILLKSGFKNINIQYYQRYNFSNHLGWFLKRKPGGHDFYKEIISDSLNSYYCENLKKLGQTDTLIAIAE